jgi:predicted transcriptional regulator
MAAFEKMVKEYRKVTSRLIANTLGIPKTMVLRILREDSKKGKLRSSSTITPRRIRLQ